MAASILLERIWDNPYLFLYRQVWRYGRAHRHELIRIYSRLTAANIILLLLPSIFGAMIGMLQNPQGPVFPALLYWMALYVCVTLIFWTLNNPARIVERRTAFEIFRHFSDLCYAKIMQLPLRWHQDHHSGDTINRVSRAGGALHSFAQDQYTVIELAVRYIGGLIALSFYAPQAAAVASALTMTGFLVSHKFDTLKLIPLYERIAECDHHAKAAFYDYVGNAVSLITLRLPDRTRGELDRRVAAATPYLWDEIRLNEAKWRAGYLFMTATQLGTLLAYVLTHRQADGSVALGPAVAMFQYITMITVVFSGFMARYGIHVRWHTDMQSVEPILSAHAALPADAPPAAPADWSVARIRNLNFSHNHGDDKAHDLRDIGLDIAAGRKIALIGRSGAGKSTLLALLRGLYEVDGAELEIGGNGFRDLRPLAACATLVPQDVEIFENTVLYNLTLGVETPQAAIDEAVALAGFGEVAARLPRGLASDIRERGVNLSGGQKQRLALARGLLAGRDSALLLLDEPTSHVDIATEAVIFSRLFAAMPDKAMIVSIHRLHLLPCFDHICLMEDGAIVQQGSFAELDATPGPFRELWRKHLAGHAGKDA